MTVPLEHVCNIPKKETIEKIFRDCSYPASLWTRLGAFAVKVRD